ncbi:hypothetical protein LTR78_001471 [Recurvomyces mirabilis]|uniref:Uncharacterized protein n=1 Tax=Recurvomyces mirabilis TaxID=574656 RepID=A0AAE1C5N4_9PEZI|nr:hypothetical protein LTR78_001471 [Recurvomyces mirabilis]KAK5161450.1 hypothetical protein LTS14_001246 [Recurvomyces mirabilis]
MPSINSGRATFAFPDEILPTSTVLAEICESTLLKEDITREIGLESDDAMIGFWSTTAAVDVAARSEAPARKPEEMRSETI